MYCLAPWKCSRKKIIIFFSTALITVLIKPLPIISFNIVFAIFEQQSLRPRRHSRLVYSIKKIHFNENFNYKQLHFRIFARIELSVIFFVFHNFIQFTHCLHNKCAAIKIHVRFINICLFK